ncbi:dihydrolipoyl dehydrogenase [Alteromonas macleodii]|uniref:dihydrolipoyl dehydrogenase n=1 Tax=Alteromonas macleodii TaxID=28108 RepID=UPI0020767DB4|nr:dihydrolipoyl dehydrogenase [Alteromonas macleodii]USI28971.1 dihydrolipoyl dehydrogenase [Alteromonas macleodii]
MKRVYSVDVAIIGAGTAGMGAYREALKYTDNILLIEGEQYGTTCARVGCMPSKLLIAPAEARHNAEKFSAFGLLGHVPKVDGKALLQRVRDERDRFVGFVKEAVDGFRDEHRIMAKATFIDDNTLALSNGDQVKAKRIIIAVGSRPNVPKMFDAVEDRLITNDDVFYWNDLPKSIAVFGAGVIGLELGQALHRLGVRVHIFGRDNITGPLTDPKVSQYAYSTIGKELPFHGNAKISRIEKHNEQVAITFQSHAESEIVTGHFDYLLAATGRLSNIDKLDIENTTLTLDHLGIPVFDRLSMQCGDSHIFLAGDVNNDIPLLHEAADEGRLAGENAGRFPNVFKRARKTSLGIAFTSPQIAVVGKSFNELTSQSVPFSIGEVSFEDQGRSRVMLVNKGLMRLYGNSESGELLGAEMIGPEHEHLAHLLAWCIQLRMSVADILQMPFYHPVIEEGLRSGLRDLLQQMGMGPQPPLHCIDCGPGA